MTFEEYIALQAENNPNFENELKRVEAKHKIYQRAIEQPRARKRLLIKLLDKELVKENQ
ncbi:hypothetical protein [Periweissella beninensis]|uniref:hypothetical protein n=1 Tax=Periweissella beninensis TaxID=504936 RepID=UPI0021A85E7C|nr:hypothetical protein [Periweissella beninensis]